MMQKKSIIYQAANTKKGKENTFYELHEIRLNSGTVFKLAYNDGGVESAGN